MAEEGANVIDHGPWERAIIALRTWRTERNAIRDLNIGWQEKARLIESLDRELSSRVGPLVDAAVQGER